MRHDLHVLFTLFPYAIVGGILISAVCAILGVFVVLKRVVFIGIALSQVAAAGIAVAFMLHWPPIIGAGLLTFIAVTLLAGPYEFQRIPRDGVLGMVFVTASALSILIVSKSGFGLEEIRALLYGDLILTSRYDLITILVTVVPVAVLLLLFLRPILLTFVDREQARVLGIRAVFWELFFFYLLGIAISGASRIGGAMLVFCYLTAPPMTGMLLSRRLWWVMIIAVVVAVVSTLIGLYFSYRWDFPTNQSITVVTAGFLIIAAISRLIPKMFSRRANPYAKERSSAE